MWTYRFRIVMAASAAAMSGGCASIPVNNARLIGSEALDLTGRYVHVVSFDRGGFAEDATRGTTLMAGPQAVLLFDYKGVDRRFDLLLVRDSQNIVYRRLGARRSARGGAEGQRRPFGVHARRSSQKLEGDFDLMMERVDDDGVPPAFEHYPRYARVVGRFVVATATTSQPTSRSSTAPASQASQNETADYLRVCMYGHRSLQEVDRQRLAVLPSAAGTVWVPTLLKGMFRHREAVK